jgi:hypothetical protein
MKGIKQLLRIVAEREKVCGLNYFSAQRTRIGHRFHDIAALLKMQEAWLPQRFALEIFDFKTLGADTDDGSK